MRACENCGNKSAPGVPRTRVDGKLLCAACASGRPGGGGVTASTHYHVSPAKNRDSIAEHGLRGDDEGRTWLYPSMDQAQAHVDTFSHWGPQDIHEVDTTGLRTSKDPHRIAEDAGGRIVKSPIPPGRVRRVAAGDHETWYHITDQHHFGLDPNHEPEDNAMAINSRAGRKGIYLTDDPDHWRASGYHRPYVAEIHVPKGLTRPERWGGEHFLDAEHFDKAKVNRVMPFDVHQRERWGGKGTVESDGGSPLPTPPEKDVRDFTPEEHTQHMLRHRNYLHDVQRHGWNEFNDKHEQVGVPEEDTDREGEPIRRNRDGSPMTGGRYATRRQAARMTCPVPKCTEPLTMALEFAMKSDGVKKHVQGCFKHTDEARKAAENHPDVVGVKMSQITEGQDKFRPVGATHPMFRNTVPFEPGEHVAYPGAEPLDLHDHYMHNHDSQGPLDSDGKQHGLLMDDDDHLEEFPSMRDHRPSLSRKIILTSVKTNSIRVLAHDSGDGETVYHCPFCGSGQVLARSDKTIECEFCHNAFTVQIQPQFPAFPQTINGAPVQVPGMPGSIDAQSPIGGDPNDPMNQDPGADPDGDGLIDPDDMPPDGANADDSAAGPDDAAAAPDDGGDFSGPASKKNQPPWLKGSSLTFKTASGAALTEEQYVRHLAIKHAYAPTRGRVAALVKASR